MRTEPVLVVCGDADERSAVARLLSRAGYATTEATTGELALELHHRPLAVVVDAGLADVHAFEVCRELRDRRGEDLPIILFSRDRERRDERIAALMIGADDYLPAPLDGGELLARLRRLLQRCGASTGDPQPTAISLTPRELEVLVLLADGVSAHAIARQLVISDKTVTSHVQRIMGKLNVHSRAQAVAQAYRLGLVTTERRGSPVSVSS